MTETRRIDPLTATHAQQFFEGKQILDIPKHMEFLRRLSYD